MMRAKIRNGRPGVNPKSSSKPIATSTFDLFSPGERFYCNASLSAVTLWYSMGSNRRILFIFLTFSLSAHSAEISAGDRSPHASTRSLPSCIDDQREITALKQTVSANSKTDFKYQKYKQLLQGDSPTELLARLAYAETLAANCPRLEKKLTPLIISAIANRIAKRHGNVQSVVFERDQFASSLNIYQESRFKEFLCPTNPDLWSFALTRAKEALSSPREADGLSADTVNYFLYKHSPKWKKEPWQLTEDTSQSSTEIQTCVRFFHNPKWK